MTVMSFLGQDEAMSQICKQTPHPLCLVQALRVYIEHSSQFRQSEQLFVCFRSHSKGLPATKQRLSHWILDAIALAYKSLDLQCPIPSTRGMAFSLAWTSRLSIADICVAASIVVKTT